MKFEFHLAIFAVVVLNCVYSSPYGLVRRQGDGYDSIIVYAVPSSVASDSIGVPYSTPSYSTPSYNAPSYNSPSYNTPSYCRHGIHSTSHQNYRQGEQTYQPLVRESVRTRNYSPYSSYDNEETEYRTPYYSVRDSFESSRRRNNYQERNSRFSQACTSIISYREMPRKDDSYN
jgi:hypothetical protein